MKKRMPRALPLGVSEKKTFVGFYHHVKTYLKPCAGRNKPPRPCSVYKVLRDERPSRALLLNIFENCPELLNHPATSADVRRLYTEWTANGHRLHDNYGRGYACARDCNWRTGGAKDKTGQAAAVGKIAIP